MQTRSPALATTGKGRHARGLAALLMSFLLLACSDPYHGPASDRRAGADSTGGGSDRPGSGGTACTYQLSGVISTASRLENTGSACDYLLTGTVRIESDLVIDPGVTVRGEPDALLLVDGGRIDARGTNHSPITLTSLSGADRYWGGIRIDRGSRSYFDYVDILNVDAAIANCAPDCDNGALVVDAATVSMRHSSILGARSHGLIIKSAGRLEQFVDNRFSANGGAPVKLPGNAVQVLDTASQYRGGNQPNGQPAIVVTPARQTANLIVRWKKLDVPYLIESEFEVADGTLLLEAGVNLQFNRDASLIVRDNGAIEASGTSGELVRLHGRRNEPGFWTGLVLIDSPWRENILRYVDILNAGASTASIRLQNSAVALRNSVVANNTGTGIACAAPAANESASIVNIDSASLVSGGIGDQCQLLD